MSINTLFMDSLGVVQYLSKINHHTLHLPTLLSILKDCYVAIDPDPNFYSCEN
jgi:hypothetical protein